MTSASGCFPHIVFSAGVSLLHAYPKFLWTSRSFPYFVPFLQEPVFHFHAKKPMVITSAPSCFSHIVFSAGVFPSPCLSYIPLDFKVFSILFFFLTTSFSLPCQKYHGNDFSLWVLPTHCLLCRCFPSPFLPYIPVSFKVFSILCSFI